MEELLREILTEMKTIKNEVANIQQDVGGLKEGQIQLQQDVGGLKEGQIQLQQDVGGLNEGQIQLRQDVGGLKEGQAKLDRRMDKVEIRLENEAFGSLRLLSENMTNLINHQAETDGSIKFLVSTMDYVATKVDQISDDNKDLAKRVTRLEKAAK